MDLPPEALLLRRMEGLLFQVATSLRACADWGGLLRELIEGGEPLGPLGVEHAACRRGYGASAFISLTPRASDERLAPTSADR